MVGSRGNTAKSKGKHQGGCAGSVWGPCVCRKARVAHCRQVCAGRWWWWWKVGVAGSRQVSWEPAVCVVAGQVAGSGRHVIHLCRCQRRHAKSIPLRSRRFVRRRRAYIRRNVLPHGDVVFATALCRQRLLPPPPARRRSRRPCPLPSSRHGAAPSPRHAACRCCRQNGTLRYTRL